MSEAPEALKGAPNTNPMGDRLNEVPVSGFMEYHPGVQRLHSAVTGRIARAAAVIGLSVAGSNLLRPTGAAAADSVAAATAAPFPGGVEVETDCQNLLNDGTQLASSTVYTPGAAPLVIGNSYVPPTPLNSETANVNYADGATNGGVMNIGPNSKGGGSFSLIGTRQSAGSRVPLPSKVSIDAQGTDGTTYRADLAHFTPGMFDCLGTLNTAGASFSHSVFTYDFAKQLWLGAPDGGTPPPPSTDLLDGTMSPFAAAKRVLDTRETGTPTTGEVVVDLTNKVPDNAIGVALNVTAIDGQSTPAGAQYISFGTPNNVPMTSSAVNTSGTFGEVSPNFVTVKFNGADKKIAFREQKGKDDVVIDLQAAFMPIAGDQIAAGRVVTLPSPVRDLDTRLTQNKLLAGENRKVSLENIALPGGLTAEQIGAVIVTLTGTNAVGPTYITAWGDGARPLASNVNIAGGQDIARANLGVIPVARDENGKPYIQASSLLSTDLIVDVEGFVTNAKAPLSDAGYVGLPSMPYRSFIGRLSNGDSQIITATTNPAVKAVLANFTSDASGGDPRSNSFLSASPGNTCSRNTSVNNSLPGKIIATAGVVPVDANGTICLAAKNGTGSTFVSIVDQQLYILKSATDPSLLANENFAVAS